MKTIKPIELVVTADALESAATAKPIETTATAKPVESAAESDEAPELQERGAWGGHLEFILTCVGYAVGLGNVWRFPYLCFKNGGGAFLIPYVIMLIFLGIPVFFLELCFGQFASLGPLAVWTANPLFKGVGCAMVAASTMVGLYYNILMSYIIYFFFASMTSRLPWTDCDNRWNTRFCLTSGQIQNRTFLEWYLQKENMTNTDIKTPSEEYFYDEILKISGGIHQPVTVVWQLALCLLLAWIVVFVVLIKGISSLGKVVYFTTLFPYIMMCIMIIRGATLDGALEGVKFYVTPDWSRLKDSAVWSDAASQIFYSLSTCSGGLIAMSSYNKFNNNVLRDSIMIPVINCLTSFFAGFAIFTVLGFMAKTKGVPVGDVAAGGPGLIFVVYPEALSQMPVAPLWAILFFFMMLTLGFSSQFSIVEGIFVALLDQFKDVLRVNWTRQFIFRVVVCLVMFLLSLAMVTRGGFYLFNIADTYAGGFPRLIIGVFELIAVTWVYGFARFADDIYMMLGRKPSIFFRATWVVIAPVAIVAIIVFKCVQHKPQTLFNGAYVYPGWADALGWMMVAGVVVWIPVWWVGRWLYDGGLQVIKNSAKPTPAWGPALPQNRTGRYAKENKQATNQRDNQAVPDVKLDPVPDLINQDGGRESSSGYENKAFY